MSRTRKDHLRAERRLLQNPYAYAGDDGMQEWPGSVDWRRAAAPLIFPASIATPCEPTLVRARAQIEGVVGKLHKELWAWREVIWPNRDEIDLHEFLNPELALQALGFRVESDHSLGSYGSGADQFRIAATIDRDARLVQVSSAFDADVQRFTTGHELGHAVLHSATGLHRDRPVNDSTPMVEHSPMELEANAFSACFLMPARSLRKDFQARFLAEKFDLNDSTAGALGLDAASYRHYSKASKRELARLLARADQFNYRPIVPLASRYRVSVGAMAYRILELALI
jgi:hypothetical protein